MKRREISERGSGGTFHADVSRQMDAIQAEDRMRMLEPTSLPKVLRGRRAYGQPNTAVLSRIAFEAFKARLWAEGYDISDEDAGRVFRGEL